MRLINGVSIKQCEMLRLVDRCLTSSSLVAAAAAATAAAAAAKRSYLFIGKRKETSGRSEKKLNIDWLDGYKVPKCGYLEAASHSEAFFSFSFSRIEKKKPKNNIEGDCHTSTACTRRGLARKSINPIDDLLLLLFYRSSTIIYSAHQQLQTNQHDYRAHIPLHARALLCVSKLMNAICLSSWISIDL